MYQEKVPATVADTANQEKGSEPASALPFDAAAPV